MNHDTVPRGRDDSLDPERRRADKRQADQSRRDIDAKRQRISDLARARRAKGRGRSK